MPQIYNIVTKEHVHRTRICGGLDFFFSKACNFFWGGITLVFYPDWLIIRDFYVNLHQKDNYAKENFISHYTLFTFTQNNLN